jgi:hypothetical protein
MIYDKIIMQQNDFFHFTGPSGLAQLVNTFKKSWKAFYISVQQYIKTEMLQKII